MANRLAMDKSLSIHDLRKAGYSQRRIADTLIRKIETSPGGRMASVCIHNENPLRNLKNRSGKQLHSVQLEAASILITNKSNLGRPSRKSNPQGNL